MKFAAILALGLCWCVGSAASAQTTSSPAPATAPATQPARFKTRVDGKQIIIDALDMNLRLTVTEPELWMHRDAPASAHGGAPLLYRGILAGQMTVAWSFVIRPMEKNLTVEEAVEKITTRYTAHMDNFAIKDSGAIEAAGRKGAFLLYTSGGVSPEDQRYTRETLVPIDEKHMLVILETSNSDEWNTARPELQAITKSLQIEKLPKP